MFLIGEAGVIFSPFSMIRVFMVRFQVSEGGGRRGSSIPWVCNSDGISAQAERGTCLQHEHEYLNVGSALINRQTRHIPELHIPC